MMHLNVVAAVADVTVVDVVDDRRPSCAHPHQQQQ